jgi:hypothetical protein
VELRAQRLIEEAESGETLALFRHYDSLVDSLNSRLDKTRHSIHEDLANLDQLIISDNTSLLLLLSGDTTTTTPNLFEDILGDMLANKQLFEELEAVVRRLEPNVNDNVKIELAKGKLAVQERFNELSQLAERLSKSLDHACHEQRLYLATVDQTQAAIERAKRLLLNAAATSNNNNNNNTAAAVSLLGELEASENELNEALSKFKTLNIKDTKRIQQIYELTTPCAQLLNSLHETRLSSLDMLAEQTQLLDAELAAIEAHTSAYSNHVAGFLRRSEEDNAEECIEQLVNCIKFMLSADFDMSKCEKRLDELSRELQQQQAAANDESVAAHLRLKLARLRKQVKLIVSKDGLFDTLLQLKEICSHLRQQQRTTSVAAADLSKMEEALAGTRGQLEAVCGAMEAEGVELARWAEVRERCVEPVEARLSALMAKCARLRDLKAEYKTLLFKIEYCLSEAETKSAAAANVNGHDNNKNEAAEDTCLKMNEFERLAARLEYFKEIKHHLLNPQFKHDLDALLHLGHELERLDLAAATTTTTAAGGEADAWCRHKKAQIRYFDIMCRLDHTIKTIEFECTSFKQIVALSQRLLHEIKQVSFSFFCFSP